jgi:aminoglycoside phosphotransferase (APT) family kinase protein
VYRRPHDESDGFRPVAFIDWDTATPGRRIHDLAHVCWQWAVGVTSPLDASTKLIRIAADAYGCSSSDRAELVDTILWWQDRCWRGIQAKIDAGDSSVQGLKEAGAVEAVRADWEWTMRHRAALEQALST